MFSATAMQNLYEQTKDIKVVQETLHHRDQRIVARYAHLKDRLTNRQTEQIISQNKI